MGTISHTKHRQLAVDVVAKLRESGFQALWAGGCVRDLLLGMEPSDYDVATSATPEQVMKLFRRTVPVGVSFGVVRVRGPEGAGEVEVATFRSDDEYEDGRRPRSVRYSTPEHDAARRDFTINGMFLDPLADHLIDYVGGRADLQAGLLRAIGDPAARFQEDKLRLLRAVRFAARFGLEIDAGTRDALVEMAPQVTVVAIERISQELRRMIAHPTRVRAFRLAAEVGLIHAILPELEPLMAATHEHSSSTQQTAWDHTLTVLDHLPVSIEPELGLAALLHKVGTGQAATAGPVPADPVVSATTADQIARRLKLSNAERDRLTWLVANHRALRDAETLRESRLKRLLASQAIDELLALHRAEALAADGNTAHIDFCEYILREQPTGPMAPEPLVTGEVLKHLGLKPSPRFKLILDAAYDAQLERVITTSEDALAWVEREISST